MIGKLFGKRRVIASTQDLELGAAGPGRVYVAIRNHRLDVTLSLSSGEARWLASSLALCVGSSEEIERERLHPKANPHRLSEG